MPSRTQPALDVAKDAAGSVDAAAAVLRRWCQSSLCRISTSAPREAGKSDGPSVVTASLALSPAGTYWSGALLSSNYSSWDVSIQYEKISVARQEGPRAAVHRYRTSRPWSVAVLAAGAAGGVVFLTGGLSSAFAPATAPVAQSSSREAGEAVARVAPRVAPATPVAVPAAPPAAGNWQIQVGAFRSADAARAELREAETLVAELAGLPDASQPRGPLMRARFGGIEDGSTARSLCGRLVDAGGRCFVVPPED